jgi:hypothetical protein
MQGIDESYAVVVNEHGQLPRAAAGTVVRHILGSAG